MEQGSSAVLVKKAGGEIIVSIMFAIFLIEIRASLQTVWKLK